MSSKKTSEVYRLFLEKGKGGFLVKNSSNRSERKLFEFCEKNFEEVSDFFENTGHQFVNGGDYFYLDVIGSSDAEPNAEYLKPRLEKLIRAITLFELIYSCRKDLDVDTIITSKEIASAAMDDMATKEKLGSIISLGRGKTLIEDIEKKVLNVLTRMGYLEKTDPYGGEYKVLSSYHHFQKMTRAIKNINAAREEEEDSYE